MKFTSFVFLFLMINSAVHSQTNVGVNIDSDLSVNNNRTYSVGTFDNRDASYKGSPLMWEDWKSASILLEGNNQYSKNQYQVNYDALAKLFYIKMGSSIYNMTIDKVNSIQIMNSIESSTLYKVMKDDQEKIAIYEVLYQDDENQLLMHTDVKVGKAFYNTALDAGNVKPSLVKATTLYIAKHGSLYELHRKRKQFIAKYSENAELKEVVEFFKENRVDLKDEEEVQSALVKLNKIK